MRGPKYVFDVSSIVRALKEARFVPLGGQANQWLIIYEVLNAIWREARLLGRLSPDEASSLASIFKDLVGWEMLYSSLRALKGGDPPAGAVKGVNRLRRILRSPGAQAPV